MNRRRRPTKINATEAIKHVVYCTLSSLRQVAIQSTVWVKKIPPKVFWHFSQTVGTFYSKF